MNNKHHNTHTSFFDQFTATKDRPRNFQLVVSALVLSVVLFIVFWVVEHAISSPTI